MRKNFFIWALALSVMALGLSSCSKDGDDEPGGSMSGDGNYGTLGTNMVATGGVRAVSYTQAILLGTVDFSKLSDTHTFGVVYMEAQPDGSNQKPYDYNINLVYEGKDVTLASVNTTADGKFEKQLVNLMPGTTYYYRSYIKIGGTYNYAEVKSFSTLDPSENVSLVTGDADDVCALSAICVGRASIGSVNNGLDQSEIRNQKYGFIYSDDASMSTAATLTMEYWEDWDNTHFDTQVKPSEPVTVYTDNNINSLIQHNVTGLVPGTTYYYRTVFVWNDRYFYSPEVKSFTTLGPSSSALSVGTLRPEDVTENTALLRGHVPFEKIGARSARGGFMISKKFSHKSEFTMTDDMQRWPSSDDISYVSTTVDDVDFTYFISSLEPGTEYHVCAYIELGRTKSTVDKYGETVPGEMLYLYGDVITFTTEEAEIPSSPEAEITLRTSNSYPWTESNGTYTSGNSGVHSSDSYLYIQVTPEDYGNLSFDWTVSSESGCDKMLIYRVNGIVESLPGSATASLDRSGSNSGTYTSTASSSPFTIIVRYQKDGSVNSGNDRVTVSNIRFE